MNRQIYAEASKVSYSKNTFSFGGEYRQQAIAFSAFLEDRHSYSLQSIQSLEFDEYIGCPKTSVETWHSDLRSSLQRSMSDQSTCSRKMTRIFQTSLHLRELVLRLNFDMRTMIRARTHSALKLFMRQNEELGAEWLTTIHSLKRLSLEVEITVYEETRWPYTHDCHIPKIIELLRSRMLTNGAALGQNQIAVAQDFGSDDNYLSRPSLIFTSDDNGSGERQMPKGSMSLETHRELCQKSGGKLDYLPYPVHWAEHDAMIESGHYCEEEET